MANIVSEIKAVEDKKGYYTDGVKMYVDVPTAMHIIGMAYSNQIVADVRKGTLHPIKITARGLVKKNVFDLEEVEARAEDYAPKDSDGRNHYDVELYPDIYKSVVKLLEEYKDKNALFVVLHKAMSEAVNLTETRRAYNKTHPHNNKSKKA